MGASFLLLNNTCRNDRTVQDLLLWCPALQLTPPRNPNIFFILSSVFHINLWHCSISTTSHAMVLTLLPLFPAWLHSLSQVCKEQTVFSHLPAAQRVCEPIAARARASYGKCILSSGFFPSWELGEGVRWNVCTEGRSYENIYLKKKTNKNKQLV